MWSKYKLETDKTYTAKIGKSNLWVQKSAKNWKVTTQIDDTPNFSEKGFSLTEGLPAGIEWQNQVVDKNTSLLLLPALPNLPFVLKPAYNFKILQGVSINFFIKIPVWVQLYSSLNKIENLLYEFPCIELSSTWFGDTDNGMLAYSLPCSLIFDLKDAHVAKYEAVCPIKISNESGSALDFQRLSIHSEELNLYLNDQFLCTNEVKVRFKGEDQINDVQISKGSPPIGEALQQINLSRVQPNNNLLKRSFYFIKSFTEY